MDNDRIQPNLDWYTKISNQKKLTTHCPYASTERCPKYYSSYSLLCKYTDFKFLSFFERIQDKKLFKRWKKSELWSSMQQPSIGPRSSNNESKKRLRNIFRRNCNNSIDFRLNYLTNFCPEVTYLHEGWFASKVSYHTDELDRGSVHERLARKNASADDWRWYFCGLDPLHYSDCEMYSLLSKGAGLKEPWWKKLFSFLKVILDLIGSLLGLVKLLF